MTDTRKEYNARYIADHMVRISIPCQSEEKALFDSYLEGKGLKASTYIKALVNADLRAQGLQPIFFDNRRDNIAY